MIDDILLQEIFSLREQLKVACDVIKKYQPDFNDSEFLRSLGTKDYAEYLNENRYEKGFEEGYKVCEQALKCCGCCNAWKWGPVIEYDSDADYTCVRSASDFNSKHTSAKHVCPEWVRRERR